MQFVLWGLLAIYVILAVAVLLGLVFDRQGFTPNPSGKGSNAVWYLLCASLMLLIATLWPIAIALESYWGEMEEE